MLYPSRKILSMVRFAFMSLPQLIASSPAPVSPFRRRVATQCCLLKQSNGSSVIVKSDIFPGVLHLSEYSWI